MDRVADERQMTLKKGFNPHLGVGELSVTGRDIEMLRAIDRYGSMHKAAHKLGRSYPHLQRRVVELEKEIGELTQRNRGGKGGGGTELTAEARTLLRQFERLRVELSGVTSVPEAVMSGTVIQRDGELATVQTDAGDLMARVPTSAEEVEIAIRADAVVLIEPQSVSHAHTSLRNQIPGTVGDLVIEESIATVTVVIEGNVAIKSMVTEESVHRLGLEEGSEVIAAFKTTAARAIATNQ